jgi:glycine/D-amino acid oxidase-like deaminating enzyme
VVSTSKEWNWKVCAMACACTSRNPAEVSALDIEPALDPRILGCLYYPQGGNANPVKTVLALASLAQRHGATMLTHHEVTDITHLDDGTYQVVTPPTTFRASTLVLATGPWCRSLGTMLGLSIPVYAVRGQMWATAPAPPVDPRDHRRQPSAQVLDAARVGAAEVET